MKRIAFLILILAANGPIFSQQEEKPKKDSFLLLEPVELKAIRAGENAPFTKTNFSKKEIEKV
ncbi:MAG: hypothetical protein EPN92_02280, partial [Chitinophagaceae bacterium]